MRQYSNIISLNKNGRGIYSLDTTIGCSSGMLNTFGGCYNDCYSARAAKIYGYDFSKTTKRIFKNNHHKNAIIKQLRKISLPFVRIGSSGDPSEDWEHTLDVCKEIQDPQLDFFKEKLEIVIITKHWKLITDEQLYKLSKLPICVNTSISALDNEIDYNRCINQYNRLKAYCKSVLRIVSCDFNLENNEGHKKYIIQEKLFKNENTLDTVFRPSKNNKLIIDGVINVKKTNFLGNKTLISKYNKKTYLGKCSTCLEMCGVKI